MAEVSTGKPRHHLFITGTGRAGTSFLVRFLDGVGLDTHLRRSEPVWFDDAKAGLEDVPVGTDPSHLPYVVKTPWLSEFIDDLLADPGLCADAVVIPLRDLAEAASSRTVREVQSLHQSYPWQAACSRTSETWGITPGGVVFSLNPLDQGRLLAVWLHQLVQRLEHADVPIIFLDFPRFAEDPDYLFRKLLPVLPEGTTLEQARAAHAAVAVSADIRTGGELQAEAAGRAADPHLAYPGHEAIDRIALGREVARLTRALAESEAERVKLLQSEDHTGPVERLRLMALAAAGRLRRRGRGA